MEMEREWFFFGGGGLKWRCERGWASRLRVNLKEKMGALKQLAGIFPFPLADLFRLFPQQLLTGCSCSGGKTWL